MIFNKIKKWWDAGRFYVFLDPKDNSVTISQSLFNHIRKNANSNEAKVFVFSIKDTGKFGFMVNPHIERETQLCDIQHNEKLLCIGFETLNPSVGLILYRYNLPADRIVKLSVTPKQTWEIVEGIKIPKLYYQIEPPK